MRDLPVTVRIGPDLDRKVEEIRRLLSSLQGNEASRSDAMRFAIERVRHPGHHSKLPKAGGSAGRAGV